MIIFEQNLLELEDLTRPGFIREFHVFFFHLSNNRKKNYRSNTNSKFGLKDEDLKSNLKVKKKKKIKLIDKKAIPVE